MFSDICPAAAIRLVTDTDILKFAYRYFQQSILVHVDCLQLRLRQLTK